MASPRANLRGIDDKSTRQVPIAPTALSQHTPLLMLMTKRGPIEPTFISIDAFDTIYDLKSLDVNSKWHSHQSELATIAIRTSNSTVVVKRIVDVNCKTASAVIGVNTVANKITVGQVNTTMSSLPLVSFTTANPGSWGNYIGVQIFKADNKKQANLGALLDSIVYEAVVIEEDELTGQQRVITNLFGESSTFFTSKPDTRANGVDYFFDDIMRNSYIEDDDKQSRQVYFSDFKLHADTFAQLATGTVPYWKQDVLSNIPSDGINSFRRGITVFAKGGDDGFYKYSSSPVENRLDKMRKYEEACKLWLSSIDESNPITDVAMYPYSTLWDSGFTKETKLEFINLLKDRKDIWIAPCVTSVNRYYEDGDDTIFDYQSKLSNQESVSLAMYYRSIFTGISESSVYGTPTVRATLIGQDGVNRSSLYRKRQSLNIDLFEKICKYCGNGNGQWDATQAFDQDGLNTLDNWHDVTLDYMSPSVSDDAWDAGVIYAQNKDVRRKFYPMYQTLYPNETSTLNNIFTMMACCWIQKKHHKSWTMASGDGRSTNLEIAERLDQYLNTALTNAFDGRFITVSKTYYTQTDNGNGFTFTTDTTIYSTVTKHTANYKITAHRMSEIL